MSGLISKLDRTIQLNSGPLRLPRSIIIEQRTIRLFMAYLGREVTQDAILNIAGERFGAKEHHRDKARRALGTLAEVGIPGLHEDLCRLVARAPALKVVVFWAAMMNDTDILPEQALIPQSVIDACMETYHHWVETLSRQR